MQAHKRPWHKAVLPYQSFTGALWPRLPPASIYRSDHCVSSCVCVCCWEKLSECCMPPVFAGLFLYVRPFGQKVSKPYPLHCKGRASCCMIPDICEQFCNSEQVRQPASSLMCPEDAVRKWKHIPSIAREEARGKGFSRSI